MNKAEEIFATYFPVKEQYLEFCSKHTVETYPDEFYGGEAAHAYKLVVIDENRKLVILKDYPGLPNCVEVHPMNKFVQCWSDWYASVAWMVSVDPLQHNGISEIHKELLYVDERGGTLQIHFDDNGVEKSSYRQKIRKSNSPAKRYFFRTVPIEHEDRASWTPSKPKV